MHLRTRLLPQHAGRHIRRHHTALCTVHCTVHCALCTVHCILPRLGRTPTTAPPPCSSPRPRPRPPPRGQRTPGKEDHLQERDDVILLQVRRGDQPGLRQSVHQPLRVSAASVANYLHPLCGQVQLRGGALHPGGVGRHRGAGLRHGPLHGAVDHRYPDSVTIPLPCSGVPLVQDSGGLQLRPGRQLARWVSLTILTTLCRGGYII